MANLSFIFCTDCGAKNDDINLFCINCGSTMPQIKSSFSPQGPDDFGSKQQSKVKQPSAKKKIYKTIRNVFFVLLVLLIGASAGAVIAAQGYLENFVGKRLTENESLELQKSAEKNGYELGFSDGLSKGKTAGLNEGKTAGLNEGKTTGIREGFKNGCNSVFDKIGEYLIAIRYPWYDSSIYGFYYGRSSICD